MSETTGTYEPNLGESLIDVTGIHRSGQLVVADFRWHFEFLKQVARFLNNFVSTKDQQTTDDPLTPQEKGIAPFWTGSARFAKYDDGWRVESVNLDSGRIWERWKYGPAWPDPYFNWNAFDESQNRY